MLKWQYCKVLVIEGNSPHLCIDTVIYSPSETANVTRVIYDPKPNGEDDFEAEASVICKLLDDGWEPIGGNTFKRLYRVGV